MRPSPGNAPWSQAPWPRMPCPNAGELLAIASASVPAARKLFVMGRLLLLVEGCHRAALRVFVLSSRRVGRTPFIPIHGRESLNVLDARARASVDRRRPRGEADKSDEVPIARVNTLILSATPGDSATGRGAPRSPTRATCVSGSSRSAPGGAEGQGRLQRRETPADHAHSPGRRPQSRSGPVPRPRLTALRSVRATPHAPCRLRSDPRG